MDIKNKIVKDLPTSFEVCYQNSSMTHDHIETAPEDI